MNSRELLQEFTAGILMYLGLAHSRQDFLGGGGAVRFLLAQVADLIDSELFARLNLEQPRVQLQLAFSDRRLQQRLLQDQQQGLLKESTAGILMYLRCFGLVEFDERVARSALHLVLLQLDRRDLGGEGQLAGAGAGAARAARAAAAPRQTR